MRAFFVGLLVSMILLAARGTAHAEPVQVEEQSTTHMRSVPVFVTGVVFDVLGAAATAGGVGLIALGDPSCHADQGRDCGAADTLLGLAGAGALVGGAVLLAIGIPLTVVGGTSVRETKTAESPPRVRVGGAGLAVTF